MKPTERMQKKEKGRGKEGGRKGGRDRERALLTYRTRQ